VPRLVLPVALAALLLGGCSLGEKKPQPIPPKPSTDTTADQGPVGTPITIRGEHTGRKQTELEVTVTEVLDHLSGSPADQALTKGARFIGVQLDLRNIGQGLYSESPLADSKLFATSGTEANPVNLLGGPCGGRFALHVTLRPKARASGCVAFELAGDERPASFQFALDSGFGPEIGTWSLR
jgi:hypothetical protein